MDLSYKFPSAENIRKKERMTYMPAQEHLVSRFKQNQTTSPLLRLPAELRLKIWQYTLGGNRILPPMVVRCHDDFYPCPSNVYLYAEPYENMRHFLSLLYVCRQIYHEARLFPFSCNIFEFWQDAIDLPYYRNPYIDWPRGVVLEQLEAIEWISMGGRRREVERGEERARGGVNIGWPTIRRMKGLKVIIKKLPIHRDDGEIIEERARRMGCTVVEEEMVELTGVYETLPRRSHQL